MVWTPLAGIWYFGDLPPLEKPCNNRFELHLLESGISGRESDHRAQAWSKFELHLLESGISGLKPIADALPPAPFELHLLESGISGGRGPLSEARSHAGFELHLLESGISGRTMTHFFRSSSLVWTPLTGIWYFGSKHSRLLPHPFRLNSTYWNLVFRGNMLRRRLLWREVWTPLTGIWYFGWGAGASIAIAERCLNSTYWNLVFRVAQSVRRQRKHDGLNSTYWNLVFRESFPICLIVTLSRLNSTYWNLVFRVFQQRFSGRVELPVWTPLTGIWYFGSETQRRGNPDIRGLNSTYWNLVFRVHSVTSFINLCAMFELHLLESGISGRAVCKWPWKIERVWTPLTGIWYFGPISRRRHTATRWLFELHLLESGISGT